MERDEFAGRRCVALPILVQKDEGPSFSLAGRPGLAVFLRDLNSDRRAKSEAETFGGCTMSLRRILGHRCHEYTSDDLIRREAGLKQVTWIVRERQLRLYGQTKAERVQSQSERADALLPCMHLNLTWMAKLFIKFLTSIHV